MSAGMPAGSAETTRGRFSQKTVRRGLRRYAEAAKDVTLSADTLDDDAAPHVPDQHERTPSWHVTALG